MLLKRNSVFWFFAIFLTTGSNVSVQGKLSTELTDDENQALQRLKPLVIPQLYQEYMKDDHYMVRFLRARKMNVEDARDMLLQSLVWRKQHKVDTILEEKLEVEKILKYLIISDRVGRPVGIVKAADWDFRRLLVAGRYDEIIRFVYKLAEIGMYEIRKAGQNVTQGIGIGDMSGFNSREHACLLCFRLFTDVIGTYEQNYPQIAHAFFSVNTPRIFQTVWEIIKPVMSDYTRNSVFVYGYDKEEWRNKLLSYISDDNLPVFLGGNYDKISHDKAHNVTENSPI